MPRFLCRQQSLLATAVPPSLSTDQGSDWEVWEEEVVPPMNLGDLCNDDFDDDYCNQNDGVQQKKKRKKKKKDSVKATGNQRQQQGQMFSSSDKDNDELHLQEHHPLRTDLWELSIRWKRGMNINNNINNNNNNNKKRHYHASTEKREATMILEFSNTGYVRQQQEQNGEGHDPVSSTLPKKGQRQQRQLMRRIHPFIYMTTTKRRRNRGINDSIYNDDDEDNDACPKELCYVGSWIMGLSGLAWELPLQSSNTTPRKATTVADSTSSSWTRVKDENKHTNDNNDDETNSSEEDPIRYLFVADFHPNPFGDHPKMVRGVIVQDARPSRSSSSPRRPLAVSSNAQQDANSGRRRTSSVPWFRPVVATFVGRGIGPDWGVGL